MMYIIASSFYYPDQILKNDFFLQLNGLTDEWIQARTGIKERRKVGENENTQTLSVEVVKKLQQQGHDLSDIDLIVAGTYTPHDLIVTHGHAVQQYLNITDIPVVMISAACSTFVNAMEVVEGYFYSKKSKKALVILADANSAFANFQDTKSGHLWGDGAAAMIISNSKTEHCLQVLDIKTGGGGNIGDAMKSVNLKPQWNGLLMPNGRDVFIHACNYMANQSKALLAKNNLTISDIRFFIPHQANKRIVTNVIEQLGIDEEKTLTNVEYLGNTGCAGSAIALSENWDAYAKEDFLIVSVFGGGYSYGVMLLQKI